MKAEAGLTASPDRTELPRDEGALSPRELSISQLSLAWLIAEFLYWVLYPDLADALYFFTPIIGALIFLSGLGLLPCTSFLWKRRQFWIAVACLSIGLVGQLTFGSTIGQHVRFAFVRHHYEARLQTILNTNPSSEARYSDCQTDSGPPIRVAFYWQRGILDNWIGLVYDPTGKVLEVNAFKSDYSNWDDSRLQPSKYLFTGKMYRAKKMADNWYLCWFT